MALRRWRAFWTIVANIRQPEPEELPKNMHAVCSPSWEFLFTSFWARYMVPSVSVASQCHITQINYCQRFDKHRIEDLEIEVDIHGRKAWIVSYHSCARQSDISAFLTGIDPFNRDEGDRICLPKNGDLKRYITGVPFNYDVLYTLTLPPGALSLTDIAALFNAVSRQDIYALSPKTHSFWHASAVYDSIKTRLGDGAETRRKSKLRRGVLDFEKPREISEAMDAIRLEWGKSMAAQHRAQEIEQAAQKRAQDIEKVSPEVVYRIDPP